MLKSVSLVLIALAWSPSALATHAVTQAGAALARATVSEIRNEKSDPNQPISTTIEDLVPFSNEHFGHWPDGKKAACVAAVENRYSDGNVKKRFQLFSGPCSELRIGKTNASTPKPIETLDSSCSRNVTVPRGENHEDNLKYCALFRSGESKENALGIIEIGSMDRDRNSKYGKSYPYKRMIRLCTKAGSFKPEKARDEEGAPFEIHLKECSPVFKNERLVKLDRGPSPETFFRDRTQTISPDQLGTTVKELLDEAGYKDPRPIKVHYILKANGEFYGSLVFPGGPKGTVEVELTNTTYLGNPPALDSAKAADSGLRTELRLGGKTVGTVKSQMLLLDPEKIALIIGSDGRIKTFEPKE